MINLFISMISARYLGPENFGLINYAASLVAFFVPLAQLGLRNTLVQEIVYGPQREGEILGSALMMSTVTGILATIGVIGFAGVVNKGQTETIVVCALYSISLIFQMTEMIQYWFQAKLMSRYVSVVSLVAYAVVSIYKVYLLITQKSIYWFAVAAALDYFLITAALFVIYQKKGAQKLSVSAKLAKQLFSRSKYYIVSGLMVTVFSQTDKIMLKLIVGDAANGFYAAAVTCAGMTGFVFSALIDSFRPVIFESKKNSQLQFEKNITRLFAIVLYAALLQSMVFTLAAELIINILYGADYIPSASVLRVITWYSAFSYMGSIRNIWILAEGKQKILWKINLSGAVLNVIGNSVLIPRMGAIGAALATVATQLVTNLVLCFISRTTRPCGTLILESLNPSVLWELLSQRRIEEN